ncbi:MAG: hypothetical protein M1837_007097 [Sclerophora amabilis]|nr:MAG: hypothetical protein M1837_007097 [Sclerophora amabilis]
MSGSPSPPQRLGTRYEDRERRERPPRSGHGRERWETEVEQRTSTTGQESLRREQSPLQSSLGQVSSVTSVENVLVSHLTASADELSDTQAYHISPERPSQSSPFVPQGRHGSSRVPRRAKAHVASACVNCRKAHLACDQESCVDVQHKKRGRPRLRDEREPRLEPTRSAFAPPQQSMRPPPASPSFSPRSSVSTQATAGSYRVLRAQTELPSPVQRSGVGYGLPSSDVDVAFHTSATQQPQSPRLSHGPNLATAFLNMDLVIEKSTPSFQATVGHEGGLVGRQIADLVIPSDRDKISRLKRELEDERGSRDPVYLPPIYGDGDSTAIQRVLESEIERVTRRAVERRVELTFLTPNRRQRTLSARVMLAKTSIYFVIVVLPSADSRPVQYNRALPFSPSYQGYFFERPVASPRVDPSPLSPGSSGPRLPIASFSRASSNPSSPLHAHHPPGLPSSSTTPRGGGFTSPGATSYSHMAYLPVASSSILSAPPSPYFSAPNPLAQETGPAHPGQQISTSRAGAPGLHRPRSESLQLPPLRSRRSSNFAGFLEPEPEPGADIAEAERLGTQQQHQQLQQHQQQEQFHQHHHQYQHQQHGQRPSPAPLPPPQPPRRQRSVSSDGDEEGSNRRKRRKFTVKEMLE